MFNFHLKHDQGQRLRKVGGFSLVEVLLTVAIIALLVSILLPALGKAKSASQASLCGSNLHSMSTAAVSFLTANQQSYWQYNQVPAGGGTQWWFGYEPNSGSQNDRPLDLAGGSYSQYLGDSIADMQCPTFPYNDAGFISKFDRHAASYGYNWRLSGVRVLGEYEIPNAARSPQTVKRYQARTDTVFLFADSVFFEPAPGFHEGFYLSWQSNVNNLSGYAHFRHSERANVLFLDGHVDPLESLGGSHQAVAGAVSGNLGEPEDSSTYGDR